ncbi:MAG: DUF1460 domain-containing protein [Clostridiales bacterium]|nr:DUF1460 domain-containing protein [Clostridiales bacterium]
MKYIKTVILSLLLVSSIDTYAILPNEAIFANEASDTTQINSILIDAAKIKDSQNRIAAIGRQFIDVPYVAGTIEGPQEALRINLQQMDCTTFVETVMALAYTAGEGRTSWRDFVYNLEKMRYRNGSIGDYSSRLHYFSDWIVDNVHRGILIDYTSRMPATDYVVKTIDYMSSNRDKYPALSDSTQYAKIKNCEIGYRNHRFSYVKSRNVGNKNVMAALKEGDVIAITTKVPGLDVSHMGIIVKIEGKPYLLHASSKKGKVVIDEHPLNEYLRRSGGSGIRVVRLNEQ